ncbi:MAG: hypothetical protein L6V90_02355 [Treponema succinifaciens]|nr:MAG: hypothetical protein L6V90_02355 [Treponema succinifaciens]
MSGNTTRTITFYGVCFDYAEFAYWDIKDNESLYIKNGMRKGQFFLAGNNSNPNVIELSVPTSTSNATKFQNGIPVRTYGNSSYKYKGTQGAERNAGNKPRLALGNAQ